MREVLDRDLPHSRPVTSAAMSRPTKFEEFRYVGDKRTQRYYDLDAAEFDAETIDELMASDQFTCFGPDTPTEARNRGYRPA